MTVTTPHLIEITVPDLEMLRPAYDHDAGCDVLHVTLQDAMDLVAQLLDKVRRAVRTMTTSQSQPGYQVVPVPGLPGMSHQC